MVETTSLGQAPLVPVQTSCGSHAPPDARHTVPALIRWQFASQHESGSPLLEPWSHVSPRDESVTPSPQ